MSEATEKSPVIRLDAHDNVVVARVPIAKGTMLHPENIVVQSDIPLGHKLATCAIAKDEPVRKYNTIIGYATRDVVPGTHMHNDTIRFDRVEHPTDFARITILWNCSHRSSAVLSAGTFGRMAGWVRAITLQFRS